MPDENTSKSLVALRPLTEEEKETRSSALGVRHSFSHGRAGSAVVEVKKSPKPSVLSAPRSLTPEDKAAIARAWARGRTSSKDQEYWVWVYEEEKKADEYKRWARSRAGRAAIINENPQASRFPATPETTAILSKENPRVRLLSYGDTDDQERLLVSGCGPIPARLKSKKKVIVEMLARGLRSRLAGRGITCDGEMVLPLRTEEVWLELMAPGAVVEVTIAERPRGTRKKYGPQRWLVRRLERPVPGRYRGRKPKV
jgi:hypothetical protein